MARETSHAAGNIHGLAPEAMKAPEVLDGSTIKTWVNASVWTLLILNFLSLLLYLGALALPALRRAYLTYHALLADRARLKLEREAMAVTPPPSPETFEVPTKIPSSNTATPPSPEEIAVASAAAASLVSPSGEISSPANPSTESQPSMSVTDIQEVLDLPKDPTAEITEILDTTAAGETAPSPENPPMAEPAVQSAVESSGIEEVFEAPPVVEDLPVAETISLPETSPAAEAPAAEVPAVAEEVASFSAPPETTEILDVNTLMAATETLAAEASLPPVVESGETKDVVANDEASEAPAAIEKNLEHVGEESPPEEASIFDPAALDKILQEEEKR